MSLRLCDHLSAPGQLALVTRVFALGLCPAVFKNCDTDAEVFDLAFRRHIELLEMAANAMMHVLHAAEQHTLPDEGRAQLLRASLELLEAYVLALPAKLDVLASVLEKGLGYMIKVVGDLAYWQRVLQRAGRDARDPTQAVDRITEVAAHITERVCKCLAEAVDERDHIFAEACATSRSSSAGEDEDDAAPRQAEHAQRMMDAQASARVLTQLIDWLHFLTHLTEKLRMAALLLGAMEAGLRASANTVIEVAIAARIREA
jgi:hypothetical protein